MTYAFVQDVPIDATFYQHIVEGLGDDPPAGLIVHLATERAEGGLRYIDVWEDEMSHGSASSTSGCTPSCTGCCVRCSATSCRRSRSARSSP